MANYQSPQDYEAELAEARQEERLRQLREEKDEQKGGGLQTLKALKGLKQGGMAGVAKELGKQELKAFAKQGTKRIMVQLLRWLGIIIATLWPYILIGILIFIIVIFVIACYDNSTECAADITQVTFDDFIDSIF